VNGKMVMDIETGSATDDVTSEMMEDFMLQDLAMVQLMADFMLDVGAGLEASVVAGLEAPVAAGLEAPVADLEVPAVGTKTKATDKATTSRKTSTRTAVTTVSTSRCLTAIARKRRGKQRSSMMMMSCGPMLVGSLLDDLGSSARRKRGD
jgi:hypothetical protein